MTPLSAKLPRLVTSISVASKSARKQLLLLATLSSALSAASMPAFAMTETQQPAVGEVTLFLGEAYIVQADGTAIPVSVGTAIRVTDHIETGSGGFVHVRFVDNELVTVRPYSSLEIVRYDYDAQNPQNSVIKLNQKEGVTRYISGEGAENAKQNFRLNTPIAAIGVRGTDFVVNASQTSVRALVNQGAIVVAPYSSMCSIDSIGPCSSQEAVELSSLSQQILEMNAATNGIATTALLPANPAQAAQVVATPTAATPAAPAENKTESTKSDIYTDTVSSRAVNQKLVTSNTSRPTEPEPPVVVVPPEYTPDIPMTTAALTTDRQLVWGRYSESAANVDNARITVSYQIVKQSDRQVTIGDSMHGLFRVKSSGTTVQPGLGVVKFDLAQAQAHYTDAASGQISFMDVLGGNLQIDFEESRFATDLQLSHAATGKIEFRENGLIFSEGNFFPRQGVDPTQWVGGAVSLDGQEAGYFFEKTLDGGSIDGLTLWNRAAK